MFGRRVVPIRQGMAVRAAMFIVFDAWAAVSSVSEHKAAPPCRPPPSSTNR